jgi:hypothetical protein
MASTKLLFARVLVIALATASATGAIGAEMSRYFAACNADPAPAETLQFAQDGMEAGRSRFCNCMADELGKAISQNDADIYAKFVAGTMTDADRMAHETFEDLHAFVMDTENTCMVIEGFADGYDPGAESELDTGTNFEQRNTDAYYAACINADWDDARIGSGSAQSTLCECMTRNLEPAYTQDEFDRVTAWYQGELDFDSVSDYAMSVHDRNVGDCMAAL